MAAREWRQTILRLACACCFGLPVVACDEDLSAEHVDAVRAERRAWRAQGLTDYVFVWSRSCFCDWSEPNGGMRVVVRDAVAQSAVGQDSGIPREGAARTIDEIYGEVLEWLQGARSDAQFAVQFDRERHFIRSLMFDGSEDVSDDELTIETSCFSLDFDDCPLTTLSSQHVTTVHIVR